MNAATPTADAPEPTPRGSGGASAPTTTKVDCRLLELALRENWDIPPAVVDATIAGLTAVITDDEARQKKPRLWLRCVEALASLSRKNLAAVDSAIRAKLADGPVAEGTLVELALRLRQRRREGGA